MIFSRTHLTTDTLFSEDAIVAVESAIFMKPVKAVETPYIKCLVREKEIKLTPEEAVRQLYIYKLIHEYGYPTDRIKLETPIHFGREVKRADITIMDKDRPTDEFNKSILSIQVVPNESYLFFIDI